MLVGSSSSSSSLTPLEVHNSTYVEGNNWLATPLVSSINENGYPILDNPKQSTEPKKVIKIRKAVKSKQLDLLSPEYLTARLNNTKVVKVKHPSLLPSFLSNRNPLRSPLLQIQIMRMIFFPIQILIQNRIRVSFLQLATCLKKRRIGSISSSQGTIKLSRTIDTKVFLISLVLF
jgi:hypothetical protein